MTEQINRIGRNLMANELSDAVKAAENALSDNLTWLDAFRSHKDATIELWKVSGKVGVGDLMNKADRIRLADKIVKHQATGDTPMPKQTKAGDAMSLVDNTDREYILAAASHRNQLQQSDTESLFDIAARLKKAVETKRAADAAQRREPEPQFEASAHRPGFRDGTQWRHDRRKRRTTEQYDPEGRQEATYVSTSEEEDEPEKSISDARNAYLDYVQNAYKLGR